MRSLLLFITSILISMNAPAASNNICKILSKHNTWYKTAKKSEKKWGVPTYVTFAIINQESTFKANAHNRKSSAYGYAQVVNRTWKVYQKDQNPKAKRNDFTAATDFIGWYADNAHHYAHISASDAYALYLAYYNGIGGYKHPSASSKHLAQKVQATAIQYKMQLEKCKNTQDDQIKDQQIAQN